MNFSVIPGCAEGASPESTVTGPAGFSGWCEIARAVVIDSGSRAISAFTRVHSPSKTGVNALKDALWRSAGMTVKVR